MKDWVKTGLSSADKGEGRGERVEELVVVEGTLSICCCLVFSSEGTELVRKRGVEGETSPEEMEEMEAERPGGRGSISRELEELWEGIWVTSG